MPLVSTRKVAAPWQLDARGPTVGPHTILLNVLRMIVKELLMPTRLPTPADFPSSLNIAIVPPLTTSPSLTNILILLHGLGDNSTSFANFGKQLSLPETTCISVQAPSSLPLGLGGFHFGDNILFDPVAGNMEFDSGFTKIVALLKRDVIELGLIQKCGYKLRDTLFLGFGQGAMAALATAAVMSDELGGLVSIGGPLPTSSSSMKDRKTPVLVCGGSSSTLITRSAVEKIKETFQSVNNVRWNRAGDDMPRNRDEILPIMRFFARQLKSHKGVPEGSIEVG